MCEKGGFSLSGSHICWLNNVTSTVYNQPSQPPSKPTIIIRILVLPQSSTSVKVKHSRDISQSLCYSMIRSTVSSVTLYIDSI